MGKVIWTEKASAHLKAIHDYIAEDSSVYAIRFVKALVQATAKLEAFPMAGRLVPEFEGKIGYYNPPLQQHPDESG